MEYVTWINNWSMMDADKIDMADRGPHFNANIYLFAYSI
jgi:hypothetical protein